MEISSLPEEVLLHIAGYCTTETKKILSKTNSCFLKPCRSVQIYIRDEPVDFDIEEAKQQVVSTREQVHLYLRLPDIPGYTKNMNEVKVHLRIVSRQHLDLNRLKSLENIFELDLTKTRVSDISPLTQLKSIEKLDLTSTGIENFEPLKLLTTLKDLYLSNTKISDITPLGYLHRLVSLKLANTSIRDISPLQVLRNLEELDLDFRKYEFEPSALQYLVNLRSLRIRRWTRNTVRNWDFLRPLAKLEELVVSERHEGIIEAVASFKHKGHRASSVVFLNRL